MPRMTREQHAYLSSAAYDGLLQRKRGRGQGNNEQWVDWGHVDPTESADVYRVKAEQVWVHFYRTVDGTLAVSEQLEGGLGDYIGRKQVEAADLITD